MHRTIHLFALFVLSANFLHFFVFCVNFLHGQWWWGAECLVRGGMLVYVVLQYLDQTSALIRNGGFPVYFTFVYNFRVKLDSFQTKLDSPPSKLDTFAAIFNIFQIKTSIFRIKLETPTMLQIFLFKIIFYDFLRKLFLIIHLPPCLKFYFKEFQGQLWFSDYFHSQEGSNILSLKEEMLWSTAPQFSFDW